MGGVFFYKKTDNGEAYDGPNGSLCYFRTNSQFRIPNSEFRILNSEFRILNSEFRILNSEFRIPNSEFRKSFGGCKPMRFHAPGMGLEAEIRT